MGCRPLSRFGGLEASLVFYDFFDGPSNASVPGGAAGDFFSSFFSPYLDLGQKKST